MQGLYVSPLCFGGMSIGDQWSGVLGLMNKETSFELLDPYQNIGDNLTELQINIRDKGSESLIGEWMEQRGIKDQIVLATNKRSNGSIAQKSNYTYNNVESMDISIEESEEALHTLCRPTVGPLEGLHIRELMGNNRQPCIGGWSSLKLMNMLTVPASSTVHSNAIYSRELWMARHVSLRRSLYSDLLMHDCVGL
ncbi:hypothetical protein F5890DRAFT_558309 [Lentinula detonsa]|uniref:Uncharacterized protein n=1 Tax=Lentinula detonsa TaxID=2804962 RepID=A0AA38Q6L7_9AGAR|nr:hypothetical protein F5890DRAFT_558309 [Lentinula detonsa]